MTKECLVGNTTLTNQSYYRIPIHSATLGSPQFQYFSQTTLLYYLPLKPSTTSLNITHTLQCYSLPITYHIQHPSVLCLYTSQLSTSTALHFLDAKTHSAWDHTSYSYNNKLSTHHLHYIHAPSVTLYTLVEGTIILLWAFVKNGYRRLDHHPPTTFQDCLQFHSSGFQSTRSPHSLPTLYDYSLTSTDCTLFYPFTFLIIHYHQPPILALH